MLIKISLREIIAPVKEFVDWLLLFIEYPQRATVHRAGVYFEYHHGVITPNAIDKTMAVTTIANSKAKYGPTLLKKRFIYNTPC